MAAYPVVALCDPKRSPALATPACGTDTLSASQPSDRGSHRQIDSPPVSRLTTVLTGKLTLHQSALLSLSNQGLELFIFSFTSFFD